jgi:ketosteroid isomerase-like protein
MHWEAERILDADGEVIVALVRAVGRGAVSGLDVETPAYGAVFTVRSGRIVQIEEYADRGQALEAVGLRESAARPREHAHRRDHGPHGDGRPQGRDHGPRGDGKHEAAITGPTGLPTSRAAIRTATTRGSAPAVIKARRDTGRAMSQGNVEVVQGMFEAFRLGDAAAAAEPLHPKVEWDATRSPVDDLQGMYHGLDGVTEFWRRWLEAWETMEWDDPPELIDAGDHVVQWVTRQKMRGRGSGIELETPPFGFVYTFRDGKVVRVTHYTDKREALEAVGLRE